VDDIRHQIQAQLNAPRLADNLQPLFCRTLLWGRAGGSAFERQLRLREEECATVRCWPIAQLAGLPVFGVDWPYERPPTVTQRREVHRALAPSYIEHLLAYVTRDQAQADFAWARRRPDGKIEIRSLPYAVGSPARTTIEQLAELAFTIDELPEGGPPLSGLTARLDRAFDGEAVTKRFFTTYRQVFDATERQVQGVRDNARRLFTQKLFNRLMFLAFLERKGWLRFGDTRTYLRGLWSDHVSEHKHTPDVNFYRDRLQLLFFTGLCTPSEVNIVGIARDGPLQTRIGDVPYLNGGLFEQDDDDREKSIVVPDEALERTLDDLFYRFNFTVTESTPLDVEVAVDPEMLGRIFEELVTGRHESGSYYTPKPIVAFMGREALKYHLQTACHRESRAAIEDFVEHHEAAGLTDPEAVLEALKRVTICDPACGSGAYLVGMLHELLDLRASLFKASGLDSLTLYQRKLEIIQNNLYGVDIDPFAVNIARLRLWLSLIVDFEGDDPPPLPNLDFKIEVGDSLTAPDPSEGLRGGFRKNLADQFRVLKSAYLSAHGTEKQHLRREIDAVRSAIVGFAGRKHDPRAMDWAIEFAEVFSPSPDARERGSGGEGGFDVVITNPPYLRQEVVKREFGDEYKRRLLELYPEAYVRTADIYVAFYARAQQLLKPSGVGCFISSNKWLRAAYGEKLRQHLLDKQAFRLVVDFGDLPVFQAVAYAGVFLWQKMDRDGAPTTWAVVGNLDECYRDGVLEHVRQVANSVPASQFRQGGARLASPRDAERRAKMEASGPRLGDIVKGQILYGVKTGLNEAFIIDRGTRDRLIADDPRSAEIIKPLLVGDDVRRYEVHFRERYLVWTYIGVPIREYPAVLHHLEAFKEAAQKRWDKGKHWWELRACDYYDAFERPKIVYPDMSQTSRFAIDERGYHSANTTYLIPRADWYLLAVLNSQSALSYLAQIGAISRGRTIRFIRQYLQRLPVPHASAGATEDVAAMARKAQHLHVERRRRTELLLTSAGSEPAGSSIRNPLEQPWTLTLEEFAKRAKGTPTPVLSDARAETAALTEEIERVEREIDERVEALYGL
jgi:type I restriction-modification system DNA methylase subunit